ncbi:MAG: hypothetical protein QM534_15050 [Sediminibacterium sp.]|nr:hypothetical protein [Sediminibacterium sp.]
MKRYFTYCYSDEEQVTCFLELDKGFYCERALYDVGGKYINTNLIIEHDNYFLPEGSFCDSLGHLTVISQTDFMDVWNKMVSPYLDYWDKLKLELIIGQKIKGEIICFYPQGVILDIGKTFHAIANYDECEKRLGKKCMYPGNKIELSIDEFDNDNLWIKLK